MSGAGGPLRVERRGAAVALEGELRGAEAEALGTALAGLEARSELTLELTELELADGVATALAVTALRALLARVGTLTLVGAPQMLAHTIYKVGMLGGALRLVEPRSDEGFGAS